MSPGDVVNAAMAVLRGSTPRWGRWDSNSWSLSLWDRLTTAVH